MKKASHINHKIHFKMGPRKFPYWDEDSLDILLELANEALIYEIVDDKTVKVGSILRPHLEYDERLSLYIRSFLEMYLDKGATVELLNSINDNLEKLSFRHVLNPTKNKKLEWVYILDVTRPVLAKEYAATMFSYLLSNNVLERVKRCSMNECKRFFAGPPNKKWCSEKCGSLHRTRKSRRNRL